MHDPRIEWLSDVERVDEEVLSAMRSGDWDRYHELMSDRIQWMVPGAESLTGWGEIGPYLSEFGRVLDFRWANRRLSASGDLAYRTMDFVMVTTTPDPDIRVRYPGKMLTVYRRQPGGRWMIEVEIWNTSPSFPETMPTGLTPIR